MQVVVAVGETSHEASGSGTSSTRGTQRRARQPLRILEDADLLRRKRRQEGRTSFLHVRDQLGVDDQIAYAGEIEEPAVHLLRRRPATIERLIQALQRPSRSQEGRELGVSLRPYRLVVGDGWQTEDGRRLRRQAVFEIEVAVDEIHTVGGPQSRLHLFEDRGCCQVARQRRHQEQRAGCDSVDDLEEHGGGDDRRRPERRDATGESGGSGEQHESGRSPLDPRQPVGCRETEGRQRQQRGAESSQRTAPARGSSWRAPPFPGRLGR